MALSGKYGKLQIPNVGDDEPVFILRAQDLLAEKAIQVYQLFACSHRLPVARTACIRRSAPFRSGKASKNCPINIPMPAAGSPGKCRPFHTGQTHKKGRACGLRLSIHDPLPDQCSPYLLFPSPSGLPFSNWSYSAIISFSSIS